MQQEFLLVVKTSETDDDLLAAIPRVIKDRFAMTAVTVVECEPVNDPHAMCGECKVPIRRETDSMANYGRDYWQDETGLRGGTGSNGRGFHFHTPTVLHF